MQKHKHSNTIEKLSEKQKVQLENIAPKMLNVLTI